MTYFDFIVGKVVLDCLGGQMRKLIGIPGFDRSSFRILENDLHHVGGSFRRAAVEAQVEAHRSVGHHRRAVERKMVLARASRPFVEWSEDRSTIVAIGTDIEYHRCGENAEA